jgi:anti-sigma B factor antagonist
VFDIRQEDREGRYRLVLTGELDMGGAAQLEAAITRRCTEGALELELDLRQLTFIDSQGLRAIIAAQEECATHNAEFFLIRGDHPAQQRLFEVTGLRDLLPWRDPGPGPADQ